MDGPRDCHTEWSKPDREKQILYDVSYFGIKKNDRNELIYETETDSFHLEDELLITREADGAGIFRYLRIEMYMFLYLKWIANKDPLYSTRTLLKIL